MDQIASASECLAYADELHRTLLQQTTNASGSVGGKLHVALLKEGITWMTEMEKSDHKGGILMDDMERSKTVQALELIKSRPSLSAARRATLLVVPATLLRQWEYEIERLLRDRRGRDRVYTLYGNKRRMDFRELNQYDIVLTSYGVLATELGRKRRGRQCVVASLDPSAAQSLSILGPTSHWHRVIFDEAESIRSDRSNAAIACCDIDATYRWCLTGTPLNNHLRALYSLLKYIRVQPCPDFDVFDMVRPAFGNLRKPQSPDSSTSISPPRTWFNYAADRGY